MTGIPADDPIDAVQGILGVTGTTRGEAVKESLSRNIDVLQKLGCFDAAGMVELRTGNTLTLAALT